MMKAIRIAALAAFALACLSAAAPRAVHAQGAMNGAMNGTMNELPDGLKTIDTKLGTGAVAVPGRTVTVNYTGWIYQNGAKGKKFDSSLDRNEPFSFELGSGNVIKGWDEGVQGMRVGGTRTLIIPPALGYGAKGTGADIPPFATLIFEVELLKVD